VTYLYCLVRSQRKPAIGRGGAPLPGAGPVRAIGGEDGLWLIVSDVDAAAYGEPAIASGLKQLEWVSARAMAHEAVVERFLRADAVLPMQLFTIFASDARALAHVTRDRRRIDRILKRVGGHLEWGLRLTWDEQAARDAVERRHKAPARADRIAGSAYLARKRDLLDVSRARLAEARSAATAVHRALKQLARDSVRRAETERAAPGSRLLLDAAYLVSTRRGSAFRGSVQRRARTLAKGGISAALSGPWPPYNFVSTG
jgi:Gas vesicle synthesis protein GvpL/GvpF